MNILILVMSAMRHPWGELLKTSMETWDSIENENTKTLYYCGTNGQSTDKIFFSSRFSENLEDISPRTLEAFQKSLELDWDYIARPNSSCYVHKKNLVAFCETLPKENVIYGILTSDLSETQFLWGGCQFILSRDVVEKFVANKDKWNNNVMEDISITLMARELEIPLESKGRCASINLMPNGSYLCLTYNHGEPFIFQNFEEINQAAGHFFIRVKHDPDRSVDIKVMRLLHQYFT